MIGSKQHHFMGVDIKITDITLDTMLQKVAQVDECEGCQNTKKKKKSLLCLYMNLMTSYFQSVVFCFPLV